MFVDICLFPFSLWFSSPREVSLSATTDSLQPGEKTVQTEDRRMLVCGSPLSQHFLSSFSLLHVSLQPLNLTSPYLTIVYGIVRGERTGDLEFFSTDYISLITRNKQLIDEYKWMDLIKPMVSHKKSLRWQRCWGEGGAGYRKQIRRCESVL